MNTYKGTKKRIQSLDLIRGIAILGILIMNINSFSAISMAYLNPNLGPGIEGYNAWIHGFSYLFADMRFMSIFSILFGVGMMIFVSNVESRGLKAAKFHYRRMLFLGVIGLLHAYLIWMGDILVPYAICACFVFLIRKWSSRFLIFLAAIFFFVPLIMNLMLWFGLSPEELFRIFDPVWNPSFTEQIQEIIAYRGPYLDQLGLRAEGAQYMQTYLFIGEGFWRYSSMMILGILLHRWNWFSAFKSKTWHLRFGIIFFFTGLFIAAIGLFQSYEMNWNGPWALTIGHQYTYVSSLLVALAYISLFIYWSQTNLWSGLQHRLQEVGRMAFTNYISSSIICTLICYGHGFGLFGKLDRLEQWLVVLLVWVIIFVGSKLILKKHKQGPLEAIWRRWTYH